MSLVKILPVALLLLLHNVCADHDVESDESSNELGLRFYDTLEMRTNIRKNIESFILLSVNYPSTMTFRFMDEEKRQISATIERRMAGEIKKCSFQPFDDELTTYNIKLRSMRNNIEIFEAIKTFKEPKDNSMDLFVMNMTDCKFTKMTLMKGYDFTKNRGAYVVMNNKDFKYFEIFSLNGKDECGTFMCRRRYYLENSTMSEPMRFELMNEKLQDWRLTFMAASSDYGYFALIRQKSLIRLLSLSAEGELINSMDEKLDSKLRFLRISTANDLFGACYIEENKPKEAQCLQLDRKLKLNFNKTLGIDEELSYITMYNLPKDGFILMTANCANKERKEKERCNNYNMKLTKYKLDGTFNELMMLKEESCAPRRRHEFQFYEDMAGKLCMFYACSCADNSQPCEEMMRDKCLWDMKDF